MCACESVGVQQEAGGRKGGIERRGRETAVRDCTAGSGQVQGVCVCEVEKRD